MNPEFRGIFPALLTPFDKNDNVNEKELESLKSPEYRASLALTIFSALSDF